MVNLKRVFISYSHREKELVLHYVEKIREMGFDPYYDDDSFYAGENLEGMIEKHIDESFCTIFFMSENSIASKWCLREMQYLHGEYETNTSVSDRSKPMRGNIVIRIGDRDIREYNKNRDAYPEETKNTIKKFYEIFHEEHLDILDSDCGKYEKLKASLLQIYATVSKFTVGVGGEKPASAEEQTKGYDLFDSQEILHITGEEGDNDEERIHSILTVNGNNYYNLGLMFYYGKGVDRDYDEALRLFLYAAKLGHGAAMNIIGEMYFSGKGLEKNPDKAFQYFTLAAGKEDEVGCYNLGQWYEIGTGGEKDYALAFRYYSISAEKGYAKSQCALGLLYKKGWGTEKNPQAAFDWIRKSADNRYNKGYNNLGICYISGIGVKPDTEEGYRWIEKSAEAGYVPAMDNLADWYRDKGEFDKAVTWYRRAAQSEYPDSLCCLGIMTEKGEGTEKDLAEAERCYALAIEKGSAWGQYRMGCLMMNPEKGKTDVAAAIFHWEQAAEGGYGDASICLGDLFLAGDGVEKDEERAYRYYLEALEKDDIDAYERARVLSCLSAMAVYGWGTEKNPQTAQAYAKEAGNDFAVARVLAADTTQENRYGEAYEKCREAWLLSCRPEADGLFWGNGVKKDAESSLAVLRRKINRAGTEKEKKHLTAKLAKYYYFGAGVERDPQKALALCRENAGEAESEFFLGKLYEDGEATEKDTEKALHQFEKVKDKEILAAVELAKIYTEGRYGVKEEKKAFGCLFGYRDRFLSDCNDSGEADYLLGTFFEEGIGCEKNRDEAILHYMMAVCKRYEGAGTRLGKLFLQMGQTCYAVRFLSEAAGRGEREAAEALSALLTR